MTQLPPASLLRLKEGDVVRLCGLDAAASGLDAAARHDVRDARRVGARLEATTGGEPGSLVCVEVAGDAVPILMSWSCSSDRPEAASTVAAASSPLGCAHVAAVLTAWIRAPADFVVPGSAEPTSQRAEAVREAASAAPAGGSAARPALAQPRLLDGGGSRSRTSPRHTLADELARLSAAEVVATARRVLGVEPDEREARVLLAALLVDPKRLAALVERLDADARTLLSDLLLLGGAITAADLDARAHRSGRAPSASRAEMTVLERHALVFRTAGPTPTQSQAQSGGERSFRHVAGWRIPPEIRQALAPVLERTALPVAEPHGLLASLGTPLASAHAAGREPERGRAARVARGSPRQLTLALALLVRAPVPYNPFASRRERAMSVAASDGRRERSTFPLLASDLAPAVMAEFARGANVPPGLARLARRALLWCRESGTDGGLRDMAATPTEERDVALRAGFRAWRDAEEPAELADLNTGNLPIRVRFDTGHAALRPAALATEAMEARGFLLRLLERARPGVWYASDDLLALLWRLNPLFLRGRQLTYASPAWWIERVADGRPLRPTRREEWAEAEGVYVRELLAGPLFWWGAVDLAFDAARVPVAFRLTPFGAYLLGMRDTVDASSSALLGGDWGPAVLLTRERELAVQPLAAGRGVLGALERWAGVSAVAGGRLVYTLTQDRAAAAFDTGASYDGLLRTLRTVEGGGERVAGAVESRLAAWRTAYGASRLTRGGTLVEAQDEATLTEALAYAPEIAARCRRVAPALALAEPDDGAALRDILKRRGYHL